MSFSVFNTLSRELQEVVPLEKDHVRLYTCGPTVYDFAHIGNFRAYMFEDLLKRHMKFRGFRVTHVMNLTDVDDKTIKASRLAGIPLKTYTAKYIDAFFQDLKSLRIEPADAYPAATDCIPEMIALIDKLVASGHAYQSEDGSVYFNIASFPRYGCLARIDLQGMKPGNRVVHDEYEKENIADFALWKAWDEKDGDVAWDSPWGRGRPGWHIECSAMSMKHLGESFDMHCGGVDNMFPHHEDEIAQSEAATGKTFVKYWLHCAHLMVEGQKMSKSLGNFYSLRQILDMGYTGREVRFVLLATHYRQSLNFTFDGLKGARSALQRIDEFSSRLSASAGTEKPGPEPDWVASAREEFIRTMDQDLNVSGALAAVFGLVTEGNRRLDGGDLSPGDSASALACLGDLDRVLGIVQPEAIQAPAEVLALVEQRNEVRRQKNWAESDRLRDLILEKGWVLKDGKDGTRLVRK